MISTQTLSTVALLTIALSVAKLLERLTRTWGTPGVLLELLTGVGLANLPWTQGKAVFRDLTTQPLTHSVSELGVLLLLFGVGLEISFAALARTARASTVVALLGVLAPFLLAFFTLPLIVDTGIPYRVFLSATLVATSVGITARVLRDLGKLNSVSGHMIMGAAVIDDVLGIVILAVITFLVQTGNISAPDVGWLLAKMVFFFVAFLMLLKPLVLIALRRASDQYLYVRILAPALGLAVFSFSAWGSVQAGLSAFIGVFLFGLILDSDNPGSLRPFLKLTGAFSKILVPVFFITMGMQVKVEALISRESLALTALLLVCAVAGKLACALGVGKSTRSAGGDPWLVALGMVPRGEVGLIFAETGIRTGVLQSTQYASVLSVAFLTTLIAPSLLSWRAKKL